MELIINGQIAELGDSMPAITKKSIDINNPSARFIDFTNSFNLPATEVNKEIFENPSIIGSNNRSFDKYYNVVINDVFQIFRGKGYLTNITKDTFSFQVVDNSKELFNVLDAKLNTTSWDDLDTVLDQTSIDALDLIDYDNCWFWGKLCLHENALQINTDQTTGDARCKYSRPSFFVSALLKRACINAGYTFAEPSPDLAFSGWHNKFWFTSYQKTLNGNYSPSGTLALSDLNTNDFAHGDLTVASTTINIGTKKTKFRLRGTVTSTAQISIVIKATDNVDGTKISESKLVLGATIQNVDFETSEFQSDNGYTIDIRFDGTGTVTFTDTLLYTLLPDDSEDLSNNPWLDYWIKVHDNLPDLTYLDLFRLICVTSNKYHIIDTYTKELSFGNLANLNKMNSVDWSDKFIIGSEQIERRFSGLYRRNLLKYSNDITVNPELGWSYFETDNDTLQDEGDYIVMRFGASNDVIINSNDISHIPVYSNTTRIADQELSIRLFYASGSTLRFDPLAWNELISYYYENWFNSLNRVRVINCECELSKLDVLSWHEKQLVYIDYLKTTFIVQEIASFIPGRLTSVKLLAYGR